MKRVNLSASGLLYSIGVGLLAAAMLGVPGPQLLPAAFGPAAALAQPKAIDDLKSIFGPALPADAREVAAAVAAAKAGETVTLRGYITADGLAADTATITLAEASKPAAGAPTVTVKFVDAKGAPLAGSLSGKHGLKPGAEVFITGKVDAADGKSTLSVTATSAHVPRASLPEGFFAAKPADDAKDVSETRKKGGLKAGDTVVLKGRVGGAKDPFVPGRAVFTLMGRGLNSCAENPGDSCKTPWDYCCETKADIAANSVVVQVVDDKGQVLRTDFKGRRGIKELTELVVTGKVSVADGKTVVVNVTSMAVVQ
jgi:hypothetical protein